MRTGTARKFSIGFMISLIMIAIVSFIVVTLLSTWNAMPQPITYIVVDVIQNSQVDFPDCDGPTITVLQNVITENIVYKCGSLGTVSEIVTIAE